MKISIVTCTYNSEHSLGKSINSILNQSIGNIQNIFIDGNSNDKTKRIILKSLRPNDFYLSENDNGIYDALNKGIKNASGDIIGILHSDDTFATDYVLHEVSKVFVEKKCDGVYGDLNFIKNDKITRKWISKKFNSSMLNVGWMAPHPTLFLKKEVFEKHGLYDTSFKIAADYDFILRIFKDESLKLEYLPIVITNMSIGGVSTSGFKNLVRKSYEDWLVLKKNKMRFPLFILLRKIFSKLSQYYTI